MPITPEWLDNQMELLQVQREFYESVLRDMVRQLHKMDLTVTDTMAWEAEKLQQSGLLEEDILKYISDATGKEKTEIRNLFRAVKTEIFNYDDEPLRAAGYDPAVFKQMSPAMLKTLNAALKKTTTEAINLTKTTAVTTQSAFIRAADVAHQQVVSGAWSAQKAIRHAVKSTVAENGVKVIYPTGTQSNIDVAYRRAVLTGINQTAGQLNMEKAREMDTDIMETTAHNGARATHAVWQGQLVSLSGAEGYLTLSDVEYDSVTGIFGANCKHNWNPYFVGFSSPAYTKEQLEEFRRSKVEYNGESMPTDKALDKQRGMERAIRKTKEKLVCMDEHIKLCTDKTENAAAQLGFNKTVVKLKQQEAKLKDFCNQTKLPFDNFRVQMFAAKTETGLVGFGKSVSQKAVHSFDKAKLPNYKKAIIQDEKFTEYALNMAHPTGKNKAIAFEKYLGYNIDNRDMLIKEVRAGISKNISKDKGSIQHGVKREVRMLISGANGKKAFVKTGWIYDEFGDIPRLTSIYVDE